MKTERELFVKKYREVFNVDKSLFVNDEGKFTDEFCQSVYEIWQSSAQREGYKLVPVEKLEELKRDADRMISSAHLYQDECHIKSFGRSFLHNYKAMIGALNNE